MVKRSNWIGFLTLCHHELARIIRIWPQTILPPIITTILYYVIFGKVMGAKIGDMGGVSYIQYIMPGLVMMSIIDNSYVNVVSSFFSCKFFKSIEEMLITPMPNSAILCGFITGGIIRGLTIGTIVGAMSLFFTEIKVHSWLLTIYMAIITSSLLSLIGFVNGVFARKFDDLSIIPVFILIPLSFFGGVFYSVKLLPPIWQAATHLNPIFYMISGFRYAILGIADVNIYNALVILTAGVVLMYTFCLWLLNKGVGIKY